MKKIMHKIGLANDRKFPKGWTLCEKYLKQEIISVNWENVNCQECKQKGEKA